MIEFQQPLDANLTAFDFTIDFSKPLSEKRKMLHFGCQANSLNNIPAIHHKYFNAVETKASIIVIHINELPIVNKEMKRCLFDLERCRRAIAGLLFVLPENGLPPKLMSMFDEFQESLAKQYILQPTYFAFETPQLKDMYHLFVEQHEQNNDFGMPLHMTVGSF